MPKTPFSRPKLLTSWLIQRQSQIKVKIKVKNKIFSKKIMQRKKVKNIIPQRTKQ